MITLTVAGVAYSYPEPGDLNWGSATNGATGWASAITANTLQTSGGSFPLTAQLDFGASYGLKALNLITQTANPAGAGFIRMARADLIEWRNNANTDNLELGVDTSDRLTFNGNPIVPSTALTASRALVSDASGVVSASSVTSTELGYLSGVSSAIQTQFSNKQPIDNDLTAIAALISEGIAARTAAGTWATRTITGTANQVTVTNGDGISGNPTLALPQSIAAASSPTFAGLTLTSFSGVVKATAGILSAATLVNADVSASAAIAYSKLNLTGSILNADLAGSIAASKLVGSDIATVGTIGTGTWQGTAVGAAYGGTGGNSSAQTGLAKVSAGTWSYATLVNADVSASAAIAYSKLNLAASIVNADVSASASIAYSKLNLGTSIVNADISGSAAIAYSKLNLATSIVNADISASAAIEGSKLVAATNAVAGAVTTSSQNIAGLKTFYDGIKVDDDASQSTLSYYRSDSYTETFTFNGSGLQTGSLTIRIVRIGDAVTIKIPTARATTGTSSNALDSDIDLPAWARPATQTRFLVPVDSGGTAQSGPGMLLVDTNGNISIRLTPASAAWPNSTATCGTGGTVALSYTVT